MPLEEMERGDGGLFIKVSLKQGKQDGIHPGRPLYSWRTAACASFTKGLIWENKILLLVCPPGNRYVSICGERVEMKAGACRKEICV